MSDFSNLRKVEEKVGEPHGSTEVIEDVTKTISNPLSELQLGHCSIDTLMLKRKAFIVMTDPSFTFESLSRLDIFITNA